MLSTSSAPTLATTINNLIPTDGGANNTGSAQPIDKLFVCDQY
jgi:hypothetical protein